MLKKFVHGVTFIILSIHISFADQATAQEAGGDQNSSKPYLLYPVVNYYWETYREIILNRMSILYQCQSNISLPQQRFLQRNIGKLTMLPISAAAARMPSHHFIPDHLVLNPTFDDVSKWSFVLISAAGGVYYDKRSKQQFSDYVHFLTAFKADLLQHFSELESESRNQFEHFSLRNIEAWSNENSGYQPILYLLTGLYGLMCPGEKPRLVRTTLRRMSNENRDPQLKHPLFPSDQPDTIH